MGEQKSTTLNSRIRLRNDYADVWSSNGDNFIPLDGEAVIYKSRTGSAPKFKLGDGVKTLSQLPFVNDYQNATQFKSGLMSANDKLKLDSLQKIEPYTLIPATSSTLGGVIIGKNLTIDAYGILSANTQIYNEATVSSAGLMSANDKLKLKGIDFFFYGPVNHSKNKNDISLVFEVTINHF